MKKYGLIIFFILGINLTFFNEKAEAAEKISDTELNITFDKDDAVISPPIETPSIIPGEILTPVKNAGRLPSTGELITSVIWILVGLSILIVFIGVHSLKQVMIKIA